ncbi:methyl-accepting chemotaxis protein [Saccharospirillum salsuginis]|uniref:Methyl-accepting chemotaxis protein n=2 Tax=Saccharospirillum salsuginis TaxID=418750 RepID=A0A918KHE3_9GAMM|nr:methyl-accepting chemotaxis protein [Saccharospirillum salsuginis]
MKSMSIRARIMGGVALTVLVLVAVNGFFNYQQARSNLVDSVNDLLVRSGENTSRFVTNWIDSKQQVLDGAAQSIQAGTEIATAVQQGADSGDFLYMYVGTRSGEMIMRPDEPLPDDYDPRTRPWFTQARQAGGPIITPPYVDASSGDLIMSFAQPVGQDVIAADIALTDIVGEVLGVRLGDSGYAAVIDGNNNFLIHPDEAQLGKPLRSLIGQAGLTPEPESVQAAGDNWLSAAFPIQGTQWRIVLMMKEGEAFANLGTLALSNLLVSALTILIVTVVSGFMISWLLKPLVNLNQALSDIAQGEADLTQRLEVVRNDEIGSLSRNFNQFIESIHALVSASLDSSHQLANLSELARDNAKENNQAVQVQQTEISQVAAAINEMSSTSANVADNAQDTAGAAQSASTEGENGMANARENKRRMGNLTEQIDTATGVIRQLDDQAQQINTILATIQDIAEQTNLLALNAAIEAARAGEQGRGFAVVADEVRALSQRTHEATGEIQTMIETLQGQTQNAVSIMDKSKDLTGETANSAEEVTTSLNSIAESIRDISERASTIAEASREQNTATEEISRIATAIQDASNQLAENIDQATAQSDELHDLSDSIRANLSRFKI